MNLSSVKDIALKHRYPIFVAYYTLYMAFFILIEKITPDRIHIIYSPLDQLIPFEEVFVIFYLAWFLYIGGAVVWLFFYDREIMCRLLWCGMIGMTLFIVISVVWPNGVDLRPDSFTRDNIFTQLTELVYRLDTSTNVMPSIHVNNSICACAALLFSEKIRAKRPASFFVVAMAILIILSTMFLKQHSVIDVTAGLVTGFVSCGIVFGPMLKSGTGHAGCN